ncbi:zinc-ribbon domain-containing protein [Anaeropeptidivorans aminofermentans]|jgi:hypothetical protein|uniref:zinc-ribbon domain-containing protein n=1 Tax=Anaeropeptidivorans aminofermentans TaxID=2934315 RepID=UPI002023F9CC|nr:zinc-ribbon domain-containing protein [Anaeropeptidivorans aminofermentans]MBE6011290.1 zinc-ribbon domain-containing protein [Lachnospiraceae bacterium]
MFFIFGFGHRTVKIFTTLPPTGCQNCHNNVEMGIVRVTSWFTLFFIPIIPYKKEYLVVCPICKGGTRISKSEFDAILQGNGLEGINMHQPEYTATHDKYAGKTETQITYLKQMEEIEREKAKNAN